jgi:hypothetical protein
MAISGPEAADLLEENPVVIQAATYFAVALGDL